MQPKPDSVPVTKAALMNIATGPWEGSEVITQGSAAPPARSDDPPQAASSSDPAPRGFRVTKELLEKFSLTKDCPKCESLRRGEERRTVHHSKDCRRRLEGLMAADAELSRKLKEIEDRQNRYMARRLGEHDRPQEAEPAEEETGGQTMNAKRDGQARSS